MNNATAASGNSHGKMRINGQAKAWTATPDRIRRRRWAASRSIRAASSWAKEPSRGGAAASSPISLGACAIPSRSARSSERSTTGSVE